MNGDTADGPTLGEAYWRGHIRDLYGDPDRFPYSALDDETRRAVETGAAAAGAAAIVRRALGQPAGPAAMADPRMVALDPALLHKELHEVIAQRDELRELLDEIGVTAANVPEDGDSFGLLEEIAMRIGAAGVPDSTPGAEDEAGQLREELARIRERLRDLAAGLELSASTSAPSKKSEIEQGCARAVRGIAEG